MSRYYLIKFTAFGVVTFHFTNALIKPVLRKITGWEDYESHAVNQANIDKFIERQEGKPVTPVPKENENYF